MRLIDADKLEEELHSFFGDYSGRTWFEIRDILGEAEEVEAISIEWLKQYGKKQANKCCHCATAIWEMLIDWEKENEKR